MNSKTMCISTLIGTIVVTDKEDLENPGIWIELRRPESDVYMSIATIEVDGEKANLRTVVFGDGKTDEPTDVIDHENIDEWFDPIPVCPECGHDMDDSGSDERDLICPKCGYQYED